MPLTLRPNITSASRHFDHLVISSELCVRRIYKREPANSPETQWLWAINGVQPAGSDVMRLADARLSASIINSSSIRCSSTGRQVGCITKTSAPRTFS